MDSNYIGNGYPLEANAVPVNIKSPLESNGAMPVNIQDQTSPLFDLYFINAPAAPTTLAADTVIDAHTVSLVDTTGFVDGTHVGIFCSDSGCFYFGNQIGAPAAGVITLDSPLDRVYAAGENVIAANRDLATANGTPAAPVIFQLGPIGTGAALEVDVTRLMGRFTDSSAMDDAMFGGITALPNGLVLRHVNGDKLNIWNIKSNGEFSIHAFDFNYSTKAPAGVFGARWRYTFAGQDKHGVTVRLKAGETLQLIVQDDLTDLDLFHVMGQGHVVTD